MLSAYLITWILPYEDLDKLVQMVNRKADSSQPCWEPVLLVVKGDWMFCTLTHCLRFVRKSRTKAHKKSDTSLCIDMLIDIFGLIVLKAELKSINKARAQALMSSRCWTIKLVQARTASSVDESFLYAIETYQVHDCIVQRLMVQWCVQGV